MAKISVIVPVYCVENYIERCARSLFEQTLDDIEYLFVDDCSPDSSIKILQEILNEYPRRQSQVIIHRMKKNSGQAEVRKWGLLNATGDFVIHCDSDDWVEKDTYQIMYENAIANNADVVICGYDETDGINHRYSEPIKYSSKERLFSDMLLSKISWVVWNKLVCRKIICKLKYLPSSSMGEDMVISAQMLYYAQNISIINKSLYNYYMNDASISNTTDNLRVEKKFDEAVNNTKLLEMFMTENGLSSYFKYELNVIKFRQRDLLFYYTKDKRLRSKWKNTFSEINKIALFLNDIPLTSRIRFYIGLIH